VRVASREVYLSRWMTVREDQIRRPDGSDGSDGSYGVIDRPDYALVIARDGDHVSLRNASCRGHATAKATRSHVLFLRSLAPG
jgi:hypothetical protein